MKVEKLSCTGYILVDDQSRNGFAHVPPPTPTEVGEYETEESEKIDSMGYPIKYRKSK